MTYVRRGTRAPGRDPFAPPEPGQRTQVASRDGTGLHVEFHGLPAGAGPTVVLVHGLSCSTGVWGPVIRALRADMRVIAYDQRGHGRSEARWPDGCTTDVLADDLEAVLRATLPRGEKAVLAGHSMGGMTIMAAAQREAVVARAAGVLLASTGCSDLNAESLVLPLARAPQLAGAIRHWLLTTSAPLGPVTAVSRAALRYATLAPGAPRDLAAASARIIHACNRHSRAAWGQLVISLDVEAKLPHLEMPAHVLVGSADRLTPPVHARRMAGLLPRCAGATELPGIGHMTPLEAPGEIAGLIRALARPPSPAEAADRRASGAHEPRTGPRSAVR